MIPAKREQSKHLSKARALDQPVGRIMKYKNAPSARYNNHPKLCYTLTGETKAGQ
jgi:hypothetical protein